MPLKQRCKDNMLFFLLKDFREYFLQIAEFDGNGLSINYVMN